MNKPINSVLSLLAAFLVLFSCACDPCDGEPGAIEIDPSDRSVPELYWEVVYFTETPDGPISAISIFTEPVLTLPMTTSDIVTVTLKAEDNQSGIEWMDIQGGFGYSCSQPGGTIVFDGIIPGNRVYYDFAEGNCALAEGEYPAFEIDGPMLCTGTYPTLSNGGYQLNGSATNGNGLFQQNQLTINVLYVP